MPHLSLLKDCAYIFIRLQRVCTQDPFSLLKLCWPQWILLKQFRADLSLWSTAVWWCGWVIRWPQSPRRLVCKCRSNRKLNLYLSPISCCHMPVMSSVHLRLSFEMANIKMPPDDWMWMCSRSACGKTCLMSNRFYCSWASAVSRSPFFPPRSVKNITSCLYRCQKTELSAQNIYIYHQILTARCGLS